MKVVFDCNVFLQAAASGDGPAGMCLELARQGRLVLVVSRPILSEFREVSFRPKVARKLALTGEIVEGFLEDLLSFAEVLEVVPAVFSHPADPKDSMYVDLAVAAGAAVITSRDVHLLSLGDPNRTEGVAFRGRFPGLEVLTPTQLLDRVRSV